MLVKACKKAVQELYWYLPNTLMSNIFKIAEKLSKHGFLNGCLKVYSKNTARCMTGQLLFLKIRSVVQAAFYRLPKTISFRHNLVYDIGPVSEFLK